MTAGRLYQTHAIPVSIGLSVFRLSRLPLSSTCPPKAAFNSISDSLPAERDLRGRQVRQVTVLPHTATSACFHCLALKAVTFWTDKRTKMSEVHGDDIWQVRRCWSNRQSWQAFSNNAQHLHVERLTMYPIKILFNFRNSTLGTVFHPHVPYPITIQLYKQCKPSFEIQFN